MCSLIITVLAWLTVFVYDSRTEISMQLVLGRYAYAYNSPFAMLSAVGLFMMFERIDIGSIKSINYVSRSVLAVLLIHTSSVLTPFFNEIFLNILHLPNDVLIVSLWVLAVLAIFGLCVIIDQVRIFSYKLVQNKLIRLICVCNNKFDY